MKLVDAHVHLDLYADRQRVLLDAIGSLVTPVIVTTRPSEYRNLTTELADVLDDIRLGLGLHPEAAGSVYEPFEFAIFEAMFAKAGWIGEIGLDAVIAERVGTYFGNVPTLQSQRQTFERVLALGVSNKTLSVHSQGAEPLVVDMLRDAGARSVALHWYRGDTSTARRAIDLGYLFSVNSGMAETSSGRDLLSWLPLDSLLVETDGPFTKCDGNVAEPRHVRRFAEELATLRSMDSPALILALSTNFDRLEATANPGNGVTSVEDQASEQSSGRFA